MCFAFSESNSVCCNVWLGVVGIPTGIPHIADGSEPPLPVTWHALPRKSNIPKGIPFHIWAIPLFHSFSIVQTPVDIPSRRCWKLDEFGMDYWYEFDIWILKHFPRLGNEIQFFCLSDVIPKRLGCLGLGLRSWWGQLQRGHQCLRQRLAECLALGSGGWCRLLRVREAADGAAADVHRSSVLDCAAGFPCCEYEQWTAHHLLGAQHFFAVCLLHLQSELDGRSVSLSIICCIFAIGLWYW